MLIFEGLKGNVNNTSMKLLMNMKCINPNLFIFKFRISGSVKMCLLAMEVRGVSLTLLN